MTGPLFICGFVAFLGLIDTGETVAQQGAVEGRTKASGQNGHVRFGDIPPADVKGTVPFSLRKASAKIGTVPDRWYAISVRLPKVERISFTPTERRRIDEGALWSPRERRNQARVAAYGTVVEWLVARTPLPDGEAQRQAAAKNREVLDRFESSEPPVVARRVLEKLVSALPQRMLPNSEDFTLTVLDGASQPIFAIGGRYVYVDQGYLQSVLADERSGIDQLAFLIAHEMGHECRGHARLRYQRQWLQQELGKDVDRSWRLKQKTAVKQIIKSAGAVLEHAYAREEDFQADLFAIHLCRNAGFDLEGCLDALRCVAIKEEAGLLEPHAPRQGTPPVEPEIQPTTTGNAITSAGPCSSVHRLRRLRLELDGLVYNDEYGLFEFDRETGVLKRAEDGCLGRDDQAVICVHGMESDLAIYRPLMDRLAGLEQMSELRILGFRYPHDDSLSRVAKFLNREMRRVCQPAQQVDFICHSAGGLVFRYYAEVEQGGFRRAFFQGTPHGGSDLARLRPLLEAKQFLGDFDLGYHPALERAIADGRGQIAFDLQPDSLFLRFLDRQQSNVNRDRYIIHRGQALKKSRALLLRAAVAGARKSLNKSLTKRFPEENTVLAKFARAGLDKLRVPDEVYRGDLAVTLESAALEDVNRIRTYPLKHSELPRDANVIKDLLDQLIFQEQP